MDKHMKQVNSEFIKEINDLEINSYIEEICKIKKALDKNINGRIDIHKKRIPDLFTELKEKLNTSDKGIIENTYFELANELYILMSLKYVQTDNENYLGHINNIIESTNNFFKYIENI